MNEMTPVIITMVCGWFIAIMAYPMAAIARWRGDNHRTVWWLHTIAGVVIFLIGVM